MERERIKAGTSKVRAAQRKVDFANAYIANGGNATQAAISAGFSTKGADAVGARLSGDIRVRAIIADAVKKATEEAEFKSEEAIRSMACAVRFDPRKLFTPVLDAEGKPVMGENGRPMMRMLETWELDDDTVLALQSIEYDEIKAGDKVIGLTTKIKVCDRNVAREQAHKFFGHYREDNKQKGDAAIVALMAAVGENAAKFEVKQ